MEGSLTVINEEFYTVDRTLRSMGLLLNEFNYNLPPSLPAMASLPLLPRASVLLWPNARLKGEKKEFRSNLDRKSIDLSSFRLHSGSLAS